MLVQLAFGLAVFAAIALGTGSASAETVMKFHTDTQFYTSVFFVVMNKEKYASLAPDIRAAIDAISGDALVTRFGNLWNQWDKPVREGAAGPGHEVTSWMPPRWRNGATGCDR